MSNEVPFELDKTELEDFAVEPEKRSGDFKKVVFTKFIPGVPVKLRFLDKRAFMVDKHYIPSARTSVLCLGDDCPICRHNYKLAKAAKKEDPDVQYSSIRGIMPRQTRYLTNVLNRTVVKVTPDGEVVYPNNRGRFPVEAPKSGENISHIEALPLNRVEVLERGSRLFKMLQAVHTTTEVNGKVTGLQTYDIKITMSDAGKDNVPMVVACVGENDEVDIPLEERYVLELVPLQLTPEEIESLLAGVSLKDIFAGRNATEEDPGLDKLDEETKQAIQDSQTVVDNLFDE